MKIKTLLGIILIAVIIVSCSEERTAKIEKIKTNTELSKTDKILKIADVALNKKERYSTSFKLQKNENGNDFLYVNILDSGFINDDIFIKLYDPNKKEYIAKAVWRFLFSTKDLGINHLNIDYYSRIKTSKGIIDTLTYQVSIVRKDIDNISGFYDLTPYIEYDFFEDRPEESKILKKIVSKIKFHIAKNKDITRIEKIKNNKELTKTDKIIKIADVTFEHSDNLPPNKIQENIFGSVYLQAIVLDSYFKYTSNKEMVSSVKSNIAKYIWRFFYYTKDLGIDNIDVKYYGNVDTDNGKVDALIYQVYCERKDLETISDFYDEVPYKTTDDDTYLEFNNKQKKIIKKIINKMQILKDNGWSITFNDF